MADVTEDLRLPSLAQVKALFDKRKALVTPEMFGAVGDGVTDDTAAIQKTLTYCENNGQTAVFSKGKTYLVSSSISFECSIDFNGATIKLTDGDYIAFNMRPKVSTDISVTESEITQTGVNRTDLRNKVFTIVSPMLLYTRSIGNENIYYRAVVYTDNNGDFITNDLMPSLTAGEYRITNIHTIGERLFVKNVRVVYDVTNACPSFLAVTRSNVHVDSVIVEQPVFESDEVPSTIRFDECAFVEMSNVYGNNVIAESGYIVWLKQVANVYIHDCALSYDGWFDIGASYCRNIRVERCNVEKFDVHYFLDGNSSLRDCTTGRVSLGAGWGTLAIDNCTFDYIHGGMFEDRVDTPLLFSGNITFDNCRGKFAHIVKLQNTDVVDDATAFNFSDTNLLFRNCAMDLSYEAILMNTTDSELERINIAFDNCRMNIQSTGFIKNTATNTSVLKSLLLRNCIANNNNLIIRCGVGYLSFVDCQFKQIAFNNADTMIVRGCEVQSLWACVTNVVINRLIMTDCYGITSQMTGTFTIASKLINNNLVKWPDHWSIYNEVNTSKP